MRSKGTYRATRRNEAREMLKYIRGQEKKATFAEVWADAQAHWTRHAPLPEVKHRPIKSPKSWFYPFSSDRQNARYARQAEGRANG
jgi:hypothetical protein